MALNWQKGLLSCCFHLLFPLFSIPLLYILIVGLTGRSNYPLTVFIYKTRFMCRGFRCTCNPSYIPCCETDCKLSFDYFSFGVLFWSRPSELEHLRLKEGLGLED